jgi:hypothetical protein
LFPHFGQGAMGITFPVILQLSDKGDNVSTHLLLLFFSRAVQFSKRERFADLELWNRICSSPGTPPTWPQRSPLSWGYF